MPPTPQRPPKRTAGGSLFGDTDAFEAACQAAGYASYAGTVRPMACSTSPRATLHLAQAWRVDVSTRTPPPHLSMPEDPQVKTVYSSFRYDVCTKPLLVYVTTDDFC